MLPHTRSRRGEDEVGPSWICGKEQPQFGTVSVLRPTFAWMLIFDVNKMRLRSETHGYVVEVAQCMQLNIQVGEVEEDPVAWIHTDDPGTVHVVWVGVGI